MSTAGVIIAVSTARAFCGDSSRDSQFIDIAYWGTGLAARGATNAPLGPRPCSRIAVMKAIRAHAFGGPDVLRYDDLPDQQPGPGQVRVRLHAVGVNPFDTYMLTGTYAIKPPLPYSPGADGAW